MNKYKKLVYILISIIFVFWIGFRINSIYQESKRQVFNIARKPAIPVNTMVARRETGVLQEPIFVKNNIAFVSGSRVNKFSPGQIINNGKIISVSKNINLDTGMYKIRTSGVQDGGHFAYQKHTGFFVPKYAVRNGKIMVLKNGIAMIKQVEIVNNDAENVLINSGLDNGDIIILSHVEPGTKVQEND
ncbi:MAG: hypothetical protein ACOX7D_00480 [Alphaproteobacteria bacterium]|jgi:hypothetical protein